MAGCQFCAFLSNDDDEGRAISHTIRQADALSARAFHCRDTERHIEFYRDWRRDRLLSNDVQRG